jgi:hypothetical protein
VTIPIKENWSIGDLAIANAGLMFLCTKVGPRTNGPPLQGKDDLIQIAPEISSIETSLYTIHIIFLGYCTQN